MKAHLMYRDRDLDFKLESLSTRPYQKVELPKLLPNEDTLTQDLEINTLFNAMAGGDKFLFEVARQAVLSGLQNDIETILYRQSVLKDTLGNFSIVRNIYNVAVEAIEHERRRWWGIFSKNYPSGTLHGAVELVQVFMGKLGQLKRLADDHSENFESNGFKTFFAMLKAELADDYFAEVKAHLKELKFSNGVLVSAQLGEGNQGTHYVLRQLMDKKPWWLGSLATTGAEETVAYLPKCDLGIVLLDAGASLNHEDLVVVQSLYRAGATAMVLISKADLLTSPDRERTVSYVRQHLLSEVNFDLPVHLVSVIGEHAQLCDQWFESELKPLLESHREATATSLKRKIGLLRESVSDALRIRLETTQEPKTTQASGGLTRAAEGLRGANAVLESAERESRNIAYNLGKLAPMVLQSAANDIAGVWLNGADSTNVAETFSASLSRFMAQQSSAMVQSVAKVRAHLAAVLEQAHVACGSRRGSRPQGPEELPKTAGLPVFDASPLAAKIALQKPRVLPLLGQRVLRHFAETKLSEQLDNSLAKFLNVAGKRLEQWHGNALVELRAAFDARAGMYQPILAQGQQPVNTPAIEASMQADAAVLENWGVQQ